MATTITTNTILGLLLEPSQYHVPGMKYGTRYFTPRDGKMGHGTTPIALFIRRRGQRGQPRAHAHQAPGATPCPRSSATGGTGLTLCPHSTESTVPGTGQVLWPGSLIILS